MERKRVSSSTIRSVGYDAKMSVLEIEFTSGSVVQYDRVSAETARRMLASPSITSFFQDHIDETYSSRRIR